MKSCFQNKRRESHFEVNLAIFLDDASELIRSYIMVDGQSFKANLSVFSTVEQQAHQLPLLVDIQLHAVQRQVQDEIHQAERVAELLESVVMGDEHRIDERCEVGLEQI